MSTTRSIAASLRARENYRVSHSAEETAVARRQDKQTHALLRKLAKLPENSRCADCNAAYPGWAALPHGVFLCIDCAQHHRRVGRHVSQVKAINTGTYLWHADEAAVMKATGNAVAAEIYLARHPQKGKALGGDFTFVQDKYDRRRWALSERDLERRCAQESERVAAAAVAVEPAADAAAPAVAAAAPEDNTEEQASVPETEDAAAASSGDANDWFSDMMITSENGTAAAPPAVDMPTPDILTPVPAPLTTPSAAELSRRKAENVARDFRRGEAAEAAMLTTPAALEARRKAELHQAKVQQVMSLYGGGGPAPPMMASRPVGDGFFAQFGV